MKSINEHDVEEYLVIGDKSLHDECMASVRWRKDFEVEKEREWNA